MICKNCDTQNDAGMKFCTHCGAEMNASATEAPSKPPKAGQHENTAIGYKPKNKGSLKMRVAIILIIAAVGAFFIGHSLTKPERTVRSYINAQVENDYSNLYDYMEIPKGDFTSKKQFVDLMNKASDSTRKDKIKSIKLSAATAQDIDDADLSSDYYFDEAYKVSYVTEYGNHSEKIVFLTKQGKTLLLFDKYYVAPIEYIAEKYVVDAPSYASVSFDGVKLDSSESASMENENGYVINNVFIGEHSITLTAPFLSDYTESVNVEDGGSTECSDLEVKPEVQSEMQEMAKNALKLFFDSSKAGKSFSEISSNIKVSSAQTSQIESTYNNFRNTEWSGFRNGTVTYRTLELVGIEASSSDCCKATFSSDVPLSCSMKLTVKYKVEATERYILWGDSDGEKTFSYTVSFSYDNNELSIFSIAG